MMGIIYVTRNLVNGKLYVGLHTRGRKDYLGSGYALAHAIRKYGRENFARADLDTFLELSEGQTKERQWIVALGSKAPAGYNLNAGGEGQFNPSDEVRAKISAVHLGKILSDATKNKIRANNASRRPEVRAKISAANKSRHPTDATKAKLSVAMMGNTNGKANKGQTPWIKGNRHTDATKAKMSKAHMGLKYKTK